MFYITLQLDDVIDLEQQLRTRTEPLLKEAAARLAAQTHAHIVERVQSQLHSTRGMYLKHLHLDQVDETTSLIWLDPRVVFLEDGLKPHEMIDELLKSQKTKTAKDGSKYLAIPLKQNKLPQETPQAHSSLQATVKSQMKRLKIPYGKIERHDDGSPKLGLLHSFDIMNSPPKTGEGPGQGWGPIGSVRQGPTGVPFLQGVRVYQRMDKDEAGNDTVKRDIMTFRMVSSKMKGSGRWYHPGIPAKKFFDEAYSWALEEWEKTIKPELLSELLLDEAE
jgi:hypothetical protein